MDIHNLKNSCGTKKKLTHIIRSSRREVIISTDSCVVAQPAGGRTCSYIGVTAVPIRKSVIQHLLVYLKCNNDPLMFIFIKIVTFLINLDLM